MVAPDLPSTLPKKSGCLSASLGIHPRVCPPSDIPDARPLHGNIAAPDRQVAATRPACSARVVLHHLDGLLRTPGFGFVAPRCQNGFAAFQSCAINHQPRPKPAPAAGQHPPPRNAVHPSKSSPRQQPYRITAAVPLLPFPSPCQVMSVTRPKPGSPRDPHCVSAGRRAEHPSLSS